MNKRIFSIMLCLCMALTLLPTFALAEEEPVVESFRLGAFDETTGTFKGATGTGTAKYQSIVVGYTLTQADNTETITLPADGNGFSCQAGISSNYNKVISISGGGKTAGEIADYVKQITFNGGSAGQDVKVTLSGEQIIYQTFFWGENGHFYQYVPFGGSQNVYTWINAYNTAMGMTYGGRQGYLATVTSAEEDLFIFKTSAAVGWLGGTRLKHTGSGSWRTWTWDTSDQTGSTWYWACGPEAGQMFYDVASITSSTYSAADTQNAGRYFNWERSGTQGYEPNSGTSETCLATLTLSGGRGYATGSSVTGYSWNDLKNNQTTPGGDWDAKGFFVEFGDRTNGDSGDANPEVIENTLIDGGGIEAPLPPWAGPAGLDKDDVVWNPREDNTLKLKHNITLTAPIVLPENSDIILDLNDKTLTGPTGEPAIKAPEGGGNNIKLNIVDNSDNGGGGIEGGDGGDGTSGSGAPAIDFEDAGPGSKIDIKGPVDLTGGNGGDGTGAANGGDGAPAIKGGSNTDITVAPDPDDSSKKPTIKGGGGGASNGGTGGDGGAGISGGDDVNLSGGSSTGGDGGASDTGKGGDGGDGIADSNKVTVTGDTPVTAGGAGGGGTDGENNGENGVSVAYAVTPPSHPLLKLTGGKATKESGYSGTLSINPAGAGTLPDSITVKVGDTPLNLTTDYTYDKNIGRITIFADKITGPLAITAYANPNAPAAGVGYTFDYATEKIIPDEGYEIGNDAGSVLTSPVSFTLGTTYKVRVKAVSGGSASDWTEFTAPSSRPDAPEALTDTAVKSKTNNTITLNTDPAKQYACRIGTDSTTSLTWVDGNGGDLDFDGLTGGTPYNVYVREKAVTTGENKALASSPSEAFAVTTKTNPADTPSEYAPTTPAEADKTAASIKINVKNGGEYIVSTSSNPAPEEWTGSKKATADGEYTFTGLEAGTKYYIHYRVPETATAMPTTPGRVDNVYTLAATPAETTDLVVTRPTASTGDASKGSITIAAGKTAANYEYRIKNADGSFPEEWTPFTDSGLAAITPPAAYEFRVKAALPVPASAALTITISAYTAPSGGGSSAPAAPSAPVEIGGKKENIGKTETTTNTDGTKDTTVKLDSTKLEAVINEVSTGSEVKITVPETTGAAATELVVKN